MTIATTKPTPAPAQDGEVLGKFKDEDGIEKEVVYKEYQIIRPTPNPLRMIIARPTKEGRESDEYVDSKKTHAGDDWEDDITACWDNERIPKRIRNAIRDRVVPLFNQ